MKKLIFIALIVLIATLCLAFSSQEIKEETFVVNVEVPVRVFSKNTFVDNLTIDDFEVYEDGKLQKIEAVYLIKKTSIERREEKKRFAPQISRHFFLWFDISEYMPRIGKAIDYFLDNVLFLGDNLVVVTPMRTYYLKSKALEIKSKEEIADQLKGIIRRDATIGNSEYRAVLKDLQNIVKVIEAKGGGGPETSSKIGRPSAVLFDAGSLEEVVQMYSSVMIRLENLKK